MLQCPGLEGDQLTPLPSSSQWPSPPPRPHWALPHSTPTSSPYSVHPPRLSLPRPQGSEAQAAVGVTGLGLGWAGGGQWILSHSTTPSPRPGVEEVTAWLAPATLQEVLQVAVSDHRYREEASGLSETLESDFRSNCRSIPLLLPGQPPCSAGY